MVNLVENWKDIQAYARHACKATARAYQTCQEKEQAQIRVLVGKFGFVKEYVDCTDKEFNEIIDFCRDHQFLSVKTTVPDDQFFK